MKAAQVVFNVSRVVLGTSHVVLQTLADATMNAEASIVRRTGYWDGNKQYELTDHQIAQYKVQRRANTKKIQHKNIELYNKLSKMIDDKKKIAFAKEV